MSEAPTIAFTWEHKFMAAKMVMDEQKQRIAKLEKALAVAEEALKTIELGYECEEKAYQALEKIAEIKKGTE